MKKTFLLGTLVLCLTNSYGQERVIIDENFESNHYEWTEMNDDNLKTKIDDGKFIIKTKDAQQAQWIWKKTDYKGAEENFSMAMTVELTKGPKDQGYGLVFGMNNDNSSYKTFYIANTGYYKVMSYYSKQNNDVTAGWIKTDLVKEGKNKLAITRKFNCLTFYINDKQVFVDCEQGNFGDRIAFILAKEQAIEVDDFKFTASPKKMPVLETTLLGFKKESLGPQVNTKYSENSPVISPDGKTIYYCTYYTPENTADKDKTDVYFTELQPGNTWGKYKSIGPPINNAANNFVISVSPDNNSLIVGNKYKADGTAAGAGISIARRDSVGKWKMPVAQEVIGYKNKNKKNYVSYCIGPDNKVMLIAMEDDDSYGNLDLCASFLQADGRWSKPMNLGNTINTNCSDFGPFLAADGKTLYFASYGHENYGSADIFVSHRLDDTWKNWSKPVNLGPDINSSKWESGFSISAKGDYAYMISSENSIEDSPDIFRIKLAEANRPDPVLLVYGKVLNKKTNQPLESKIAYYDLSTNKEIGIATSNAGDGSYKIILPAGLAYSFLAGKEGYFPVSENIKLDSLKEYMEIEKNLYLAPVEIGETIRLNNIFFDLNKATLKTESAAELDRLVKFLKSNPTMKIEIAGHTDNIGSDEYNEKLSQQRTESVVAYLGEKGIDKTRLKAKGYGESKPIATNDTEDGKAQNRRVEFSILEK